MVTIAVALWKLRAIAFPGDNVLAYIARRVDVEKAMAMEVENEEEGTGNGDLGGSVCVQHI